MQLNVSKSRDHLTHLSQLSRTRNFPALIPPESEASFDIYPRNCSGEWTRTTDVQIMSLAI